jgi:hypothetical protein
MAFSNESPALRSYVVNVLNTVVESAGDRAYQFQAESITMETWLNNIIRQENIEETCRLIAERLHKKEIDAQEQIEHLDKEIPKGMLIISLVDMELSENDEHKIVISKADYNEFIEQTTSELKTGLPTKKKIYKAFIANVSSGSITKLTTYDSNTKFAKYWWKDFLELEIVITDEENTKNAFNGIEKEILLPIKKKHKHDYLLLWNASIAYFRRSGEFDLLYYRDGIIGEHNPYDNTLDINYLKLKVDRLPEKYKFDQRFEKIPSEIHKRFKSTLNLTNEIDLIIKHDIANPEKTIKPHSDADGKYIMIRSDVGYEYALTRELES